MLRFKLGIKFHQAGTCSRGPPITAELHDAVLSFAVEYVANRSKQHI